MDSKDKYIIQLDGLRFYAVFSVMIAHWLQWQWGNVLLKKIPFVHGVTFFFVLSGFLISRILFQNKETYLEQNKNKLFLIKNFYIRRFFRIFPIYYATIIGLFLINFDNTRSIFVYLITYTSNIYQSIENIDIGSFNHFWSLAVEEQFYLFWAFVILFTKNHRSLTVIISTIILALITKYYIHVFIDNWRAISYLTISCLDSLGLGALLAYLVVYKKNLVEILSKPFFLYLSISFYIGLLILSNYFNIRWYKEIFDGFVFAIVAALIILKASNNGFRRKEGKYLLENSFINYSGKISYGLYIFHLFIPSFIYWLFPNVVVFNNTHVLSKYVLFIIYYLLTFTIAHFSYKFIEAPINRMKNRFPYI